MGYAFFTETELASLGLRHCGRNVLVHNSINIVAAERLSIGDNSRIDAFVTISAGGGVEIGRNVHVGSYCYLAGGGGITVEDFAGLSQGVKLYSVSDDYSGEHMTNPTVPGEFTGVTREQVHIGRHAIVGAGSVILPGVVLGEGSALGALSLATRSLDPWMIYAGAPARRVRLRSKALLDQESQYLAGDLHPT